MTTATFELVDGNSSVNVPVKKLAQHIVRVSSENPDLVKDNDVLFRLMDLASQAEPFLSNDPNDPIDKVVRSLFEQNGPEFVDQQLKSFQQAPRTPLRQRFDPAAIQLEPITRNVMNRITTLLTEDDAQTKNTPSAEAGHAYRAICYLARKAFHGASIDGAIRLVGSELPVVTEAQYLYYNVLKKRADAQETLTAHDALKAKDFQPS